MEHKPIILTRDVLVPIGVVSAVIGFGIVGMMHFNSWAVEDALWKERTTSRVHTIETIVERNTGEIRDAAGDRWRKADMRNWAVELDERNQAIDVPRVQ